MKTIRPGAAVVAAALLAAAAATAFLACSCRKREPVVGLFLYNEADPYIKEFARQILDQSAPPLVPQKFDAGNSQLIQNEQLDGFLSRSSALVIFNPVDRLGSHSVIRRLQAAGVPAIFFNREPLEADLAIWEKSWYVGARAEQSGQLQASLVMDLFGGEPGRLNEFDRNGDGTIQAIILKGEQGHQDAEIRTREVLRSFEEKGFKVEVLALEIANWNRDEAYTKMARLLREFQGRMELVVSNNDAMALGAISMMRQAGMFQDTNRNGRIDRNDDRWIPVVGIDGLEEAEKAIAEGYLYGTVKNDSLSMAKAIVELAGVALGRVDPANAVYPPEDGKYVWIDYRPFVSEE